MIPVLFKEDEQVFSHNGIGALYESLSCDVIEEENGSFTMELEYPVDGEWFSEIKDFRIIQAKPNDIDEPHNFRIYEIVKSVDELTVYVRANTRTNDLGNNLITGYFGKSVTPQQVMNGIKNNLIEPTNFDLISDIETTSDVEWTRMNPLNAIVGTAGSLVSIWGGQIKRTNTAIYLYSRRGRDNVVTIRPGKNIEGLNMTVSTAGLVTKILPTFTYSPVDVPEYQMVTMHDGSKEKRRVPTSGGTVLRDDITVLGDVVSSQYVDNYPTNYWSSVDYGDDDELRGMIEDYINNRLTAAEESPTILDMSGFENDLQNFVKTELDKKANQYFTYRNPGADKPTVRITANMLQLSDSPDWEDFKDLERIGLTDTLDVWVEDYDIDVEVRVTTLTYDSIGERVRSFNAGSDRAPRQSVMEKKYDEFIKSTNDYITSFKNGVQNVMRNTADGLNRRFEGYTEPPAELSSEGDIWFKDIGEGKVELWIHDGTYWQPLLSETFADQIRADVDAAQAEAEAAQATADATVNNINQVVNDNGFTTLDGLFASKISGEEAETMFYQEAEAIGLVYMEDGVQKAIISIQDGIPYIKGENVILDGNTIVDGDFKVTGDMLADGAVIRQLEVEGIDAQNVNIINLDAASISGGNLELSKGLKITHNGKVIFGVNAYNQIAMDEAIREELKGDPGEQGTGVSKAVVTYAQTTSGTVTPTSWSPTRPPVTKGQYLWTRTVTTYTDTTTSTTYSVAYSALDGQKGDEGAPGTDGTDGTGVSGSVISYAQTTSGTATPTDWLPTRPAPVKGQYLWTRTVINYTDDTKSTAYSTSYSALDGQKGDKGDPGIEGPEGPQGATGEEGPRGATGTSVESITEYYLATPESSDISSTDSRFTTTMQPMTATNKYLWNYEEINFSDNTSQPTIPVIIGVYGDKGDAGATGRSIVSITEHYLATSANSGVTRSTSGWSTTMQPTTETKRYLWNYETINWSSGTTPTYVPPIIIGVHGAKGDEGDKGDTGDIGPQGPPGIQGPPGANGQSQWTYIRYSDNANGSGMDDYPTSTTKYIGIVVTDSESVPPYGDFTWSKYIGEDGSPGPQGIPGNDGNDGDDGTTTYTWVKYADTPTSGMNDFPDGKKYIGLAFNQTTATESTSYSAYQWSLMPQNIEIGGRNYIPNSERELSNTGLNNYFGYNFDPSPLVEGEVVTVSFEAKSNLNNFNMDYYFRSGATNNLPQPEITVSTTYKRYDVQMTVPSWKDSIETVHFRVRGDGTLYIRKVKLEKGNIATDWTEAPEDAQARLDDKVDRDNLENYVPVEGYQDDIGEINTSLRSYMSMLEQSQNDIYGLYELDQDGNPTDTLVTDVEGEIVNPGVIAEINDLLNRSTVIESNLTDFTSTWNFLETKIIMGKEGMLVGEYEFQYDAETDEEEPVLISGIMIGSDRIDFVNGDHNEPVAFITGNVLQINHGIFVKTLQVGEHLIETISGGHTIWQWVDPQN